MRPASTTREEPLEASCAISDHADVQALSVGQSHHVSEGRVERRFPSQKGDLTDTMSLTPSHHTGEEVHTHPSARAEEIGREEAISATAITLRRNVGID